MLNSNKNKLIATVATMMAVGLINTTTVFSAPIKHVTINVGESYKLNQLVLSDSSLNIPDTSKILWKSNNPNISISSDGTVRGVKNGSALVTGTIKNSDKTVDVSIDVKSMVSGITLDKTTASLKVGEEMTLIPTISPSTALKKEVTWKCSNPDIAEVSNGKVKALKEGRTSLVATTVDGNIQAFCYISVNSTVTGINLNEEKIDMYIGDRHLIKASVLPVTAFDKKIKYYIEDDDDKSDGETKYGTQIISVTNSGQLKGLKEGTAYVRLRTEDGGFSGRIKVCVHSDAKGLIIVEKDQGELSSLNLVTAQTTNVLGLVYLNHASYLSNLYDVEWSSSDKSIFKVSSSGNVEARSEGTAMLEATVIGSTGTFIRKIPVTVRRQHLNCSLDRSTINLDKGEEYKLTATIYPNNAVLKKITWESSNEKIAKVLYGKVCGVGKGTAKIIVRSADGTVLTTCIVNVSGQQVPNKGVYRIYGQDRFSTSINTAHEYMSKLGNKNIDAVILTNGLNFPDALSSGILAKEKNAPILLSNSSVKESSKTLSFIYNNLSKKGTIYILGGEPTISEDFVSQLKSKGYTNIIRLGGKDRFETNIKIVDQVSVNKGTPIIIVNGQNFPDALSVSAVSAIKKYPILMSLDGEIPKVVQEKIKQISPSKVYIIGGMVSINNDALSTIKEITNLSDKDVVRIYGNDRYETSMNVCNYFDIKSDTIVLASGEDFPDSLSGTPLSSILNSNVLMINGKDIEAQKEFLKSHKISRFYILGGNGSVNQSIEDYLKSTQEK